MEVSDFSLFIFKNLSVSFVASRLLQGEELLQFHIETKIPHVEQGMFFKSFNTH